MEWNAQPAAIDVYHQRVWDWRDIQWLYGLKWGAPADLTVSGIQAYQLLDADLQARLGTNDVRMRQFDVTASLIAPPGEAWYAVAENQEPAPELADVLKGLPVMVTAHTIVENPAYHLSRFDLNQRLLEAAQRSAQIARDGTLPVKFGETAELIGYDLRRDQDQLTLITYWRAGDHIITPLQMFVHVLNADNKIVAQADRLDAPADDWRFGDAIAQVHHLDLPPDVKNYLVEIGLYNPETGARLPVMVNGRTADNRLILSSVSGR